MNNERRTMADDYQPRCREVWFQSKDEALVSAQQTADSQGGAVVDRDSYVVALMGQYTLLIGRWINPAKT
jgi:hypothetical protein